MRFPWARSAAALGCGALLTLGCGGSDVQPEMPSPSVVDQSADDLGLPQATAEESSGGAAESSEPTSEAPAEESEGPLGPVRVVVGESTPLEGASPSLRILAPRNGQRVTTGNVSLRLQLRGWELEPDPGRHVHVIVDNEPYIAVRDLSAPIDLNELVQRNLGHELAEGTHVVRVFPSRAHHESVKSAGAFATVTFHYRQPTEGFAFDARAPLLTFSRPKGCNAAGQRVLLDFFVSNAALAADGTQVRYELDGTTGTITQWLPHWIEGLRAGQHTLRLTLVGADGAPLAGPFNDTTRTFTVAPSCS
ncbi:MAG: hypothetical protein K8H88_29590 [Sandaracinaceae bacterium]|nr:hypothetical protein [Sandaracinaceae bacterium]